MERDTGGPVSDLKSSMSAQPLAGPGSPQFLVDWPGGASTAAIAGGIAGVLPCGEQAWRSRTSSG